MYDPKEVLNESGYRDLQRHVGNMEEALFFFLNNSDDLHISATDGGWQLETLLKMQKLLPLLLKGDGEKVDDDG